jgi:PadR family transcriptional regulator, regulatory protein PadR
MPLGRLEGATLASVARLGDDAYGAEIRRDLEKVLGREYSLGAVYVTLERLAAKGWLRSTMSDPRPERGGRSRRCYTLTPSGRAVLRESERELFRIFRPVVER